MTLPPNVDSKGGQKAVLPRLLSRASSLALLYLLAGALWVLLSDSLLARMVSDSSQMIQWQLFKGLFFIAASALLLWGERSRSDHRVQQAEEQLQKHLEESNAELDRVRKQLHAILENAPIAFAMRGL